MVLFEPSIYLSPKPPARMENCASRLLELPGCYLHRCFYTLEQARASKFANLRLHNNHNLSIPRQVVQYVSFRCSIQTHDHDQDEHLCNLLQPLPHPAFCRTFHNILVPIRQAKVTSCLAEYHGAMIHYAMPTSIVALIFQHHHTTMWMHTTHVRAAIVITIGVDAPSSRWMSRAPNAAPMRLRRMIPTILTPSPR